MDSQRRFIKVFSATIWCLVKNSVFVGDVIGIFLYDCRTSCGNLRVGSWKENWGKSWRRILLISMVSPPFIASLAYIQLFGRNGLITKGILGLVRESIRLGRGCRYADVYFLLR